MTRLCVLFSAVILGAAGSLACTAQVYGRAYSPPPPPPPALSIRAGVGASVDVGATAYVDSNPDVPDTNVFYQPLVSYGAWTTVEPYGQVWVPRVAPDWRPYSYGHWTYTDVGWTWVSDEPFGWAVFHYGRWYRDPSHHWVWVPGTHWAPAWVVWRHGGHRVGWAPLPPGFHWRAGIGFDVDPVTVEAEIGPHAWHFVHERFIDRPDLRRYYEPRERNVTLIRRTRNATRYKAVNHRIVDAGIDVREVERARGVPVRRMRLVDRPEPGPSRMLGSNEVAVYVPPEARHRRAETGRSGRNRAVTVPSASSRRGRVLREREETRAEREVRARDRQQPTRARRAAALPRRSPAPAVLRRQQADARASSFRQQQRAERRAAAREARPKQRHAAAAEARPKQRHAAAREARPTRRRPAANGVPSKRHATASDRHGRGARAPGRAPDRTARRERRSR